MYDCQYHGALGEGYRADHLLSLLMQTRIKKPLRFYIFYVLASSRNKTPISLRVMK
jgi:hypothetical protein